MATLISPLKLMPCTRMHCHGVCQVVLPFGLQSMSSRACCKGSTNVSK